MTRAPFLSKPLSHRESCGAGCCRVEEKKMKKGKSRIKNSFFSGLFFLLPVALTVYVVYYISRLVYHGLDFIIKLVPESYTGSLFYHTLIILASLIIIIFGIALVGVIIRTVVGRALERLVDRLFGFFPGVKGLYRTLKQIFDLVFRGGRGKEYKPVLVQYPHRGSWALAFLTGKCTEQTTPDAEKEYYTVFMPTTPNPTSGFLMIFPEDEIRYTGLTPGDAFKLIMSGGIVKE
jgi:uncharacterized membrane protein